MGSSGEKRKGRKHLPKAGTRPDRERLLHRERAEVMHGVGLHTPREERTRGGRAGMSLATGVLAALVALTVVAFVVVILFVF